MKSVVHDFDKSIHTTLCLIQYLSVRNTRMPREVEPNAIDITDRKLHGFRVFTVRFFLRYRSVRWVFTEPYTAPYRCSFDKTAPNRNVYRNMTIYSPHQTAPQDSEEHTLTEERRSTLTKIKFVKKNGGLGSQVVYYGASTVWCGVDRF